MKRKSCLIESCFFHVTVLSFLRKSVYIMGNFCRLLWQRKHVPEYRMTQNTEHRIFPECSDWQRDQHKIERAPGFFPRGVKSLKCETDRLTPISAELRMTGTIPLLPRTPSQHGQRKLLLHLNFCCPASWILDPQPNYYLNHCPESGKHGSKRLTTVTTGTINISHIIVLCRFNTQTCLER